MNFFSINTPKGERKIGQGQPCFIIAEMSGNHNQNYNKAVDIIKAAAEAGADAIKLQTYTPDTISVNCNNKYFQVGGNDNPDVWEGKTMYELYKTAYTPWEWQKDLKKVAEDLGLAFFSMSVDETGIDFLESIDVSFYKVGSYELIHLPLLKRIGKTGKPVIMSVGYGSEEEIKEAIYTLRTSGTRDIALLHCVTAYAKSTEIQDLHLRNFKDMQDRFGVVSGFSENAGGIDGVIMAVLAGASLVEKHLIIDRKEGGPDATFSVEPKEFSQMVKEIRRVEKALGSVNYGPVNEKERYNSDWCRPSIFVVKDIKKGENFSSENIRVIRPGNGMKPKYYEKIIGKKAIKDIEFGTPLTKELIKKI
jgi:pseudaminic acid synthase